MLLLPSLNCVSPPPTAVLAVIVNVIVNIIVTRSSSSSRRARPSAPWASLPASLPPWLPLLEAVNGWDGRGEKGAATAVQQGRAGGLTHSLIMCVSIHPSIHPYPFRV